MALPRVHPAVLALLLVSAGVVLVLVLPPPYGAVALFVVLAPGFGLVSGLLAARQAAAGGDRARRVAGLLRSVAARPAAWLTLALIGIMAAAAWAAGGATADVGPALAVVPLFLAGYAAGLLRWVPASWDELSSASADGTP